MKKLLILVVLLLTSCITVIDFGVYWDKGTIDPALEGKWKAVSEDETHPVSGAQDINLVKEEDSYQCKWTAAGNKGIFFIRSITFGNYNFLMVKDRGASGYEGYLFRYTIEGNKLSILVLQRPETSLYEVMEKKYPENLYQGDTGAQIKLLDEKTAAILAEVPDDHWTSKIPNVHYEKAN